MNGTTATVTDWAALHRDLADVYARHGRPDDARVHRQLADLLERQSAHDAAWDVDIDQTLEIVR